MGLSSSSRSGVIAPSEFDRHVIKPARREAAIEMPHPRNDHAHHRHFDVGPRLIEHEEIEARSFYEIDAGHHLLARIEAAKF